MPPNIFLYMELKSYPSNVRSSCKKGTCTCLGCTDCITVLIYISIEGMGMGGGGGREKGGGGVQANNFC